MNNQYQVQGLFNPHNGTIAIPFLHKTLAHSHESAMLEACSFNPKGSSHYVRCIDLNSGISKFAQNM